MWQGMDEDLGWRLASPLLFYVLEFLCIFRIHLNVVSVIRKKTLRVCSGYTCISLLIFLWEQDFDILMWNGGRPHWPDLSVWSSFGLFHFAMNSDADWWSELFSWLWIRFADSWSESSSYEVFFLIRSLFGLSDRFVLALSHPISQVCFCNYIRCDEFLPEFHPLKMLCKCEYGDNIRPLDETDEDQPEDRTLTVSLGHKVNPESKQSMKEDEFILRSLEKWRKVWVPEKNWTCWRNFVGDSNWLTSWWQKNCTTIADCWLASLGLYGIGTQISTQCFELFPRHDIFMDERRTCAANIGFAWSAWWISLVSASWNCSCGEEGLWSRFSFGRLAFVVQLEVFVSSRMLSIASFRWCWC